MKMKKTIAILSAAGLLLSGTPVSPLQSLTVCAEQSDIVLGQVSDTISGHLTDTIDWSLDLTNGVLTISGEGAMPDYLYEDLDAQPWSLYFASIKKIVISEGVTSIGDYSFFCFYNLTDVRIAKSVTSIGTYAFYYCYALPSITIPQNVSQIGDYAFYYCSGLKEVLFFPDSDFAQYNKITYIFDPEFLRKGVFFAKPESLVAGVLRSYKSYAGSVYNLPDLNDDGAITAADAQIELEVAMNEQLGYSHPQRYRATDFNKDYHITATEAQFILTYYINNYLMEDEFLTFYDIVPSGYLGKP